MVRTFGMVALIAGVLAVGGWISVRQKKRKLESRLRNAWGTKPFSCSLDGDGLADVAAYWREKQMAEVSADSLDDVTWSDLDLDAVFRHMNRTKSNVGEEALYAMLRDVGTSDETLQRRMRWIEALGADDEGRTALQMALVRIGKDRYHSVYPLLFRAEDRRTAHSWLYYALACLPIVFVVLGIFNPLWLIGFAGMFLVNAVVYYRTQSVWASEQAAVRHLAKVLHVARKMARCAVTQMEDATETLGGLCGRLKAIARWNALYVMQPANDMDFLTDYIRILFQLDMISLTKLTAFVHSHAEAVQQMYALVGEIDACIAVASQRAACAQYCVPEFTKEMRVKAVGIAHPLVREPVRNTMHWAHNALITGSNASGKSTFIKALALNAVFAQSIGTCWAEHFAMPRARVLSSMALRDDVRGGDSYFVVEIKSLRRILTAIDDSKLTLCFVDEILRGTNTVERIATSTSLLRHLEGQNVLCVAATHDVELTQLLGGYEQHHFREEMTDAGMIFSYRLMDGHCMTRNAIRLLEQMEFPPQIIRAADDMAAGFDECGKWGG